MLKRPYDGEHGSPNDPKKPRPNDSGAGLSLAEKIKAAKAKAASLRKPAPSAAPSTPGNDTLAAIRARVAALKSNGSAHPVQPVASEGGTQTPRAALQISPDGISKSDMKPPEAANTPVPGRRSEQKSPGAPHNPYYTPDDPQVTRTKTRVSRTLLFNQQGKYLDQASKLRSQARLEQLKATIAKQARLAGLDQLSERNFMIPTFEGGVEWWDEGLLDEKSYDCIDDPSKVKIDGDDSMITSYVQHPTTLPPAQDRRLVEVKPLYLTQKEAKKLRRLRRAEQLKEEQAKVRLGLSDPVQPKIKRSNMMKILGESAVAEPSRVEMLVEAQIQERQDKHDEANQVRKLTKEERNDKLAEQKKKDALKGLYVHVYAIRNLSSKHRFLLDMNSKQHSLTGMTIFNPHVNLVIVEGGDHSMTKFSRLMQQRINFSQNDFPSETQQEKLEREPRWMNPLDDEGALKDFSGNKCSLIFSGEIKTHNFRKLTSRFCETDGEAREVLSRSRLDSLWSAALASLEEEA